ncbi:MAG TPA: TonB C-terminal domain-containing protein [Thermodesulfovibrionales bacterium]|jgi:outer membrane biosynthesis protein TonB|nr:TonB C-terminal domain-containing protein [Thermodesulfovibrionales bacterium]
MPAKQDKRISVVSWALFGLMVVIIGAAVYIVKGVLSGDSPQKKSNLTTVTLLKPPPPLQIKEKPPEPEQFKEQKKEEIFTEAPQDVSQRPGDQDSTPAGDNLGVDAEGTAGGDAFGLVGKKGGKSLIGGGGTDGGLGKLSLLTKFSGYTRLVEAEVRKKVMKRLDEEGGIPKGKLQAVARVSVDGKGVIVSYRIIGSSGDHRMDEAINKALNYAKISEPPPDGMPRTMVIKITSQG